MLLPQLARRVNEAATAATAARTVAVPPVSKRSFDTTACSLWHGVARGCERGLGLRHGTREPAETAAVPKAQARQATDGDQLSLLPALILLARSTCPVMAARHRTCGACLLAHGDAGAPDHRSSWPAAHGPLAVTVRRLAMARGAAGWSGSRPRRTGRARPRCCRRFRRCRRSDCRSRVR